MSDNKMGRRLFLQSTAAVIGAALATPAFSATNFMVGGVKVVASSDGYFDMPTKFFVGATAAQQTKLGDTVRIGANVYTHHSGNRVFLFGTGAGNADFITSQFASQWYCPRSCSGSCQSD